MSGRVRGVYHGQVMGASQCTGGRDPVAWSDDKVAGRSREPQVTRCGLIAGAGRSGSEVRDAGCMWALVRSHARSWPTS